MTYCKCSKPDLSLFKIDQPKDKSNPLELRCRECGGREQLHRLPFDPMKIKKYSEKVKKREILFLKIIREEAQYLEENYSMPLDINWDDPKNDILVNLCLRVCRRLEK